MTLTSDNCVALLTLISCIRRKSALTGWGKLRYTVSP